MLIIPIDVFLILNSLPMSHKYKSQVLIPPSSVPDVYCLLPGNQSIKIALKIGLMLCNPRYDSYASARSTAGILM